MAETKTAPVKAPIVNAADRQPMEMRFEEAEAIKANHPDRHFRFVNTQRKEVGELRTKVQGYTPTEGAESLTIGELRLMSCPKGLHDERQKRIASVGKAREGKIMESAKAELSKLGVKPTND